MDCEIFLLYKGADGDYPLSLKAFMTAESLEALQWQLSEESDLGVYEVHYDAISKSHGEYYRERIVEVFPKRSLIQFRYYETDVYEKMRLQEKLKERA